MIISAAVKILLKKKIENLLTMTKNEYKVFQKYQKMKPSEFLEYVFGIKLFAYQKILVDVFADIPILTQDRNYIERFV